MSWRDQLQPASFRDIPFYVVAGDADIGRRVQVHEFPLRDKPFVEDLGRKTRRFSVDAYVLGDAYMDARDALMAALEQPGPGDLVHRYLGRLNVVVETARGPRESTREGGMAVFYITFVESGDAVFLGDRQSTVDRMDGAADTAVQAAQDQLAAAFSVDNQPAFVLDAATGVLQDAASAVRQAVGAINAATAPLTDFIVSIDAFNQEIAALIQVPDVLAARVASLVASIQDISSTAADALAATKKLFAFGSHYVSLNSNAASLQRQTDNQTALVNVMRQVALAEACRLSSRIAFESADQAQIERDTLLDEIDAQAVLASDALFAASDDLRAALVRDIAQRVVQLPHVYTYTPTAVLPMLVLAQTLHGDATRAPELIARNRVRHPGFVPGGVALQVLND